MRYEVEEVCGFAREWECVNVVFWRFTHPPDCYSKFTFFDSLSPFSLALFHFFFLVFSHSNFQTSQEFDRPPHRQFVDASVCSTILLSIKLSIELTSNYQQLRVQLFCPLSSLLLIWHATGLVPQHIDPATNCWRVKCFFKRHNVTTLRCLQNIHSLTLVRPTFFQNKSHGSVLAVVYTRV